LRVMIQSYYVARGWDENGLVPENKLEELCLPKTRGRAPEVAG
jgi:hypothetical protein